jgi:hypothetical protein
LEDQMDKMAKLLEDSDQAEAWRKLKAKIIE